MKNSTIKLLVFTLVMATMLSSCNMCDIAISSRQYKEIANTSDVFMDISDHQTGLVLIARRDTSQYNGDYILTFIPESGTKIEKIIKKRKIEKGDRFWVEIIPEEIRGDFRLILSQYNHKAYAGRLLLVLSAHPIKTVDIAY
jgi:hypothetical protein